MSPLTLHVSDTDIPGSAMSLSDTARALCTSECHLPVAVCFCPCWRLSSRHDLNSRTLGAAVTSLGLDTFHEACIALLLSFTSVFFMHCYYGLP